MKKLLYTLILFLISNFAFTQAYKLMWEDNFDNPILDEARLWTVEVNGDGGGNNEMQYYRRENITIEQHPSGVNCLVISAKRENYAGKVVTSGRLNSRGNLSCKYGKIEARIKLPPTANGLWPAFWMLGEDFSSRGWPRCGEIDILEMGNAGGIAQGKQDRFFNGACHWGESWTYYAKDNTSANSLQDDFHLFTLIWDQNNIKMYLDQDKYPAVLPYYEMSIVGDSIPGNKRYYFNKPFSLLFNLAVGGTFTGIVGNANIDKITALPIDGSAVKMYIDYVRIYQKGEAGEAFDGPSTLVETEPPTAFVAALGAVTPNSVELLLNANDNSGEIIYTISYGITSLTVKGLSGIQKSYLINGLNSATAYHFSISAKDASGNIAANNPILLDATTGIAYSNFLPIDYETMGQDWSWSSFGNGNNAPTLYAVVNNPSPSGINTSAHVASYTVNTGAMSWAGIFSDNIGTLTFTPDNCKVKLMVYKPFISNFLLKFENGTLNFEKAATNTLINQWEEITFDLSGKIGQTITRMVLIPDNSNDRSTPRISYWDNISFNSNKTNGLQNLSSKIHIFPNPVHKTLYLHLADSDNHLTITDLFGRCLLDKNLVGNSELNMEGFLPGIYSVKIENGREIYYGKFVKD